MDNIINKTLLERYDSKLKESAMIWQKGKAYTLDTIIQFKGNTLKCTTAGTSGTTGLDFTGKTIGSTITDGTVTWTIIDPSNGQGIAYFASNTAYKVDDVVIHNNLLYRCTTAHTSTSVFDDTKFTPLTYATASNADVISSIFGSDPS